MKRYFKTDPTGLEHAANRLGWAVFFIILVCLFFS